MNSCCRSIFISLAIWLLSEFTIKYLVLSPWNLSKLFIAWIITLVNIIICTWWNLCPYHSAYWTLLWIICCRVSKGDNIGLSSGTLPVKWIFRIHQLWKGCRPSCCWSVTWIRYSIIICCMVVYLIISCAAHSIPAQHLTKQNFIAMISGYP